ncbi:hypothetical protein PFAG_00732 [Plasmodium falciparum Santa Lucia]|uniref:Uncharacterized protein n=13 Tax=Plasmodium falciparum TaxID=5833 RepID=Q8I1S5_PLAF7|nr:conserved protein, unknown function [Plasmodium falciparum 3D7]ETW32116.1 hypothetical protein PFFCH_00479 [Plasmodium falciparum FCH/4]ETW38450.1 hypothetical protein PFTANZ_00881 [Plasmodium falciparum Tanzania (2000708)]ETW44800.1 hypothetical protein PFNF135_00855 [Plasmodium falciparum NF135/5.C10]ETW51147.1 hypothetical protein PFMALIP_00798 [Plasmodium falciparum MaliPS096_E11]ETW56707.1 hypothetical protein PFUGPA_01497 [Plasmodium falciparum Palo Alto/Uganda]ETW63321.1 hypothetica|eukprot:XP_001351470.1 conserved protein, unknown function [Plasmodium falciparum 3D7]
MDMKVLDDEIMLSDGRIIKMPVKNEEDKKDSDKGKIKIDKVPNVWGSSAGAGSDYFDLYRKQRNEENERMELIEKNWKEYTENQIFQSKRKEKIDYIQKKSEKRKNKRLMKKNKIKELRINKKGNKNDTTTQEKQSLLDKCEEGNEEKCVDRLQKGEGNYKKNNKNDNDDNISLEELQKIDSDENDESLAPPVDTKNFLVVKEDEVF